MIVIYLNRWGEKKKSKNFFFFLQAPACEESCSISLKRSIFQSISLFVGQRLMSNPASERRVQRGVYFLTLMSRWQSQCQKLVARPSFLKFVLLARRFFFFLCVCVRARALPKPMRQTWGHAVVPAWGTPTVHHTKTNAQRREELVRLTGGPASCLYLLVILWAQFSLNEPQWKKWNLVYSALLNQKERKWWFSSCKKKKERKYSDPPAGSKV